MVYLHNSTMIEDQDILDAFNASKITEPFRKQRADEVRLKVKEILSREAEVACRESEVEFKAKRLSELEVQLKKTQELLNKKQDSINSLETKVKKESDELNRNIKLSSEKIKSDQELINRTRLEFNRQVEEENKVLSKKKTELEKYAKELWQREERLNIAQDSLEANQKTLESAILNEKARATSLQKALDIKATDLAIREREYAQNNAELLKREQKVSDTEKDQERLKKGLNKAKLDISTRMATVERREKLIDSILKNQEVKKQLAELE